jgi:hypothetical protein
MQFSPDGHLLLQVGEAKVPGADDRHFHQPSGVTAADEGTFYVSDGYRNTRVLHFSADGRELRQWGKPGTGPGQFGLPHCIVLGRDGLIHVADHQNSRMQSFDRDGTCARGTTRSSAAPSRSSRRRRIALRRALADLVALGCRCTDARGAA